MPQLSPEIKSLLSEKDTKHSASVGTSVCTDDVDYVPVVETLTVEMPAHQDQSVIGELKRELEECEVSLDDNLLKDSTAAIELNRKLFQQKLQEMNRHHLERLELVGKNMHRQRIHEQERRRLNEMSMLVYQCPVCASKALHCNLICRSLGIENWKHNILREYRVEEEVSIHRIFMFELLIIFDRKLRQCFWMVNREQKRS